MYGVVGTDGVVYGPVTVATLFGWIAQGRVVPTTILIDGYGRQMPASSVPELQAAFPIQPPPYYPGPDMVFYAGPTKRKSTALLLAFLLGFLGAHRFYLGYPWSAAAMSLLNLLALRVDLSMAILLAIVTTVWLIVDMAAIGAGRLRPARGVPYA